MERSLAFASARSSSKHMQRILIVEDHPHIARIINDVLQQSGFITSVVSNGVSAVERAAEFQPALVFMDLTLPRMSGAEAIERIRELPGLAAVPFIVLSASLDSPDRLRASAQPGVDFVAKPFSPRALAGLARERLKPGSVAVGV